MRELTELEKVMLRKIRRFQKEMAIMEEILLNGTEEPQKEVKRYNPADDLKYFNDKDFNDVWKDYISVRTRKRASNSDRAIKQAITNLIKLSKGNKRKAIAIVDQSVNSGWTGLFEPKDYVVPVKEKKETNTERYNYRKEYEENPEEFTEFDPNNLMGLVKQKSLKT